MDIIPGVDIRAGRCVRLVQGDYARETVFADDPVAVARRWVEAGARRLHVVDLDGAREGRPVNDGLVARIIAETGARVEVAGGVRDEASFERWFAAGAERVVVGTLAVEDPDTVERMAARHPGGVAAAVDARDGRIAVKGWLETTGTPVPEFMRQMRARGVRHFVYTDTQRDGTMEHPDFGAFRAAVEAAGLEPEDGVLPVIFGGGITDLGDIEALAREPAIEGVIIGRALYDGRVDLRAAISAVGGNGPRLSG
jgi:phosphoribosylformimino-5-aminoimidazole carboxamide ribotide isomerase